MANDAYIPTTYIWESSHVLDMEVTSKEFKELIVRLYQDINTIQLAVNARDAGSYDTNEFICGQQFFSNPAIDKSTNAPDRRQVYRKVVNFGALPNSTTKSVAHRLNITRGYTFTRLYGAASDTTNKVYLPIPNANADINLEVDATNVKIKTASNLASFDTTYVILEYLKQ